MFFLWPHFEDEKKKIVCFISSHKFGKSIWQWKTNEMRAKIKKEQAENNLKRLRENKIMSIINMSTIQWQWISEWITICRCWWWTPCISFPVNQPLFLFQKKLCVHLFVCLFVWMFYWRPYNSHIFIIKYPTNNNNTKETPKI